MDTDVAVWDQTMDVNLRGYMIASKHVIPHMRRSGGGSIINVSSNSALIGDSTRVAYGCSKSAVLALTRYIACHHGLENIRCNSIMPGLILDDKLDGGMAEYADMVKRHLLLPRHGKSDDIAALAAFFASSDSAFITGQAMGCDGGLLGHQPFLAEERELQAAAERS